MSGTLKSINGPEHRRDPLTVVIASLGGDILKSTIEALNQGSVVPDEILVCIPKTEVHRVSHFSFNNVVVVATDCRGQVAQRAIGFQSASYALVMQLDDDMLVDEKCVEQLIDTLKSQGPEVAVGPYMIEKSTGRSVYDRTKKNKILDGIYFWFMNGSLGYQPGTITRSGLNIGRDPSYTGQNSFPVEWLAGGCVMHHKFNLVLENFFPFEGKAYCEDVIHTHLLRMRGIKLLVDPKAHCRLETIHFTTLRLGEFVDDLVFEYQARKYFVRISSRSLVRLHFFYLVRILIYIVKKIRSLLKRGKSDSVIR